MKRNLRIGPEKGKIIAAAALMGTLAAGLFAAPLDGVYTAASREARLAVLKAAEKYLNTPYRFGGVSKDGLDCSGLIYLSFQDALGVSPPRSAASLYAWVERIADEQAQPGDILFFKTNNSGKVSHAGIYIGQGRFIHSASEGPELGVIYSSLSEKYWARCYTGAGRALPEADMSDKGTPAAAAVSADTGGSPSGKTPNVPVNTAAAPAVNSGPGSIDTGSSGTVRPGRAIPAKKSAENVKNYLTLNVAAAPSWGGILEGGHVFRGFTSQLGIGIHLTILDQSMLLGMETRPEWDGGLGVFRLPFTLSWGVNDKFRVFFGPALSFGDASFKSLDGQTRHYEGGTTLFGTAGFSIAPVDFSIGKGKLAPYAELAWQSYTSDNSSDNLNADIAAGLRFSTGIRYTIGGK